MKFYLYGPGDDPNNLSEDNELGETTLGGSFWCYSGYTALVKIIHNYPDYIEQLKIKDDSNKEHTVEQFLEIIKKYKLIHK